MDGLDCLFTFAFTFYLLRIKFSNELITFRHLNFILLLTKNVNIKGKKKVKFMRYRKMLSISFIIKEIYILFKRSKDTQILSLKWLHDHTNNIFDC